MFDAASVMVTAYCSSLWSWASKRPYLLEDSWAKDAEQIARVVPPKKRLARFFNPPYSELSFSAKASLARKMWLVREVVRAQNGGHPEIIDVYGVTIEYSARSLYLDDLFMMGKTIGD
jgi:hypothetical protein